MPRYIGQHQIGHNGCGPIAILNVLKWAGVPTSYRKHYPKVAQMCECIEGTQRSTFEKTLKSLAKGLFSVTAIRGPTLKEFYNMVDCGAAAVLLYHNGWCGHFCFIPEVQGKKFICINDDLKKTVCRRSIKEMKRYFRFAYEEGVYFPKVWFIEKI